MSKKWSFDPFEGYRGNQKWLKERTIFLTVHGSQCYGTSTPESDIDVKGLCIPPKEYFFGFTKFLNKDFEQAESSKPYDMVIYDIRKFLWMASNCNPNIIEVLFTDPEDWILETKLFRKLWENRSLFLSKKARYTFSGYANQQLKRIEGHKRWLLNPPKEKPTREDFGLPVEQKLNATELGATQKLIDDQVPLDANVIHLFHQEQAYQNKLREWQQYKNWEETRNEKRACLEAKFGFDTKHAMHLVRLMRMCKEILLEKEVRVRRPDAEELLAIRNGAWTYDQLIEWADKQDEEVKNLYEVSTLPKEPNINAVSALCEELVEEALQHNSLHY